ncbi:hypothetical protein FQA39_LY03096 [Lamprigera yunnana]|nr:hypothetical protein FQA39_LY03096 [Lamprigera yunnana]
MEHIEQKRNDHRDWFSRNHLPMEQSNSFHPSTQFISPHIENQNKKNPVYTCNSEEHYTSKSWTAPPGTVKKRVYRRKVKENAQNGYIQRITLGSLVNSTIVNTLSNGPIRIEKPCLQTPLIQGSGSQTQPTPFTYDKFFNAFGQTTYGCCTETTTSLPMNLSMQAYPRHDSTQRYDGPMTLRQKVIFMQQIVAYRKLMIQFQNLMLNPAFSSQLSQYKRSNLQNKRVAMPISKVQSHRQSEKLNQIPQSTLPNFTVDLHERRLLEMQSAATKSVRPAYNFYASPLEVINRLPPSYEKALQTIHKSTTTQISIENTQMGYNTISSISQDLPLQVGSEINNNYEHVEVASTWHTPVPVQELVESASSRTCSTDKVQESLQIPDNNISPLRIEENKSSDLESVCKNEKIENNNDKEPDANENENNILKSEFVEMEFCNEVKEEKYNKDDVHTLLSNKINATNEAYIDVDKWFDDKLKSTLDELNELSRVAAIKPREHLMGSTSRSTSVDSGISTATSQDDHLDALLGYRECICSFKAQFMCPCQIAVYCSESCQLIFFTNGELSSPAVYYPNSTICTSPGYVCLNCSQSVYCQYNGYNYTVLYDEVCGWNSTCFNGTCTTRPNPKCDNITQVEPDFICRTPGMYPDPYDCRKYHYCVHSDYNSSLLHFEAKCDCNYAYSANTTFCDRPISNSSCGYINYPLPRCRNAGDTGSLWQNPSLYYICQYHPKANYNTLYPFMYACENGKTYNSYEYLCK